MIQLLGFAVTAAIAAGLVWVLLRTGLAWEILDQPNERSLHDKPTPRVGGICMVLAFVLVALWLGTRPLQPIIAVAAGLSAFSLADDIWGLRVALRLPVHIAAAIFVFLAYPLPAWFSAVPLIIAMVWMTNLYNFMDGLDGLAGGMTAIGFSALAIAAGLDGSIPLSLLAACVAGAALGFLTFNIHPARVFLGDAGAIPLGLLAASLSYIGVRDGIWNWCFPLVVFSPFIADATVTLIKRSMRGERVWRAHRTHYYQRLAQSDLGHRRTAFLLHLLMGSSAGSAVVLRHVGALDAVAFTLLWITAYGIAMIWIDRRLATTVGVSHSGKPESR